jgi:hypothetical protein
MAKKTKEEKQQAKALKIQQREAKQQEKFTWSKRFQVWRQDFWRYES